MIKQKGLKITIFVLLIVLTVSAFSILLINVTTLLNKGQKANVSKAADVSITSFNKFRDFVSSVNSGNKYSGKVIELNMDIDCGGGEWRVGGTVSAEVENATTDAGVPFEGTFNGKGHAIKNVTSTNGILYNGFFTYNKGTIKNLRLVNHRITVPADLKSTNYEGVLVGKNEGTVENCIVENCKFTSDRAQDYCKVAGIAGYNSGTVINCMVNGSYEIGANKSSDGLKGCYFCAGGTEASNCIFTASVTTFGKPDKCLSPEEYDTGALSNNYSSCSSAYDLMPKHATYKSDISTTAGESGTVWYKYKSLSHGLGDSPYYNDGTTIYYFNVYLRSFINFTTYSFYSEDAEKGRVSNDTLVVPSDYDATTIDGSYVKTTYGNACRALPTGAYSFSSWSQNGKSFTAHFSDKICEISFMVYDWECVAETNNLELNTDYYIPYGGNLKITYDKCGAGTFEYTYWDDYEYKEITKTMYSLNSITYEFYGKDEAGNWATRKITYRPLESKYCIGINTEGITTSLLYTYQEGNNRFEPYSSDWFGSPSVFLKKYNIEFN